MNDQPSLYYVLQSRKFWATLIGLILMVVTAIANKQPIDVNTLVNGIVVLVGIYVGATALEDGLTKHNAGQTTVSTPSSNVDISTSDTPAKPTVTDQGLL